MFLLSEIAWNTQTKCIIVWYLLKLNICILICLIDTCRNQFNNNEDALSNLVNNIAVVIVSSEKK